MHQLVSVRDKALEKIREQNTEMAELKQKLEVTADDLTAYESIQSMLVAMQSKMQSALDEIRTTLDTFTKQGLCRVSWTGILRLDRPDHELSNAGHDVLSKQLQYTYGKYGIQPTTTTATASGPANFIWTV